MANEKRLGVDVAIIGTGGAGLAAAIEARSAGARVAMVGQGESPGGASIISGGGCLVVGTPLQKALGIQGSPDEALQEPPFAWAVLDDPMTANMEVADPYYRCGDRILRDKVKELLDNSPYIRKAHSLTELGRKMEVDLPTFLSTVDRYNQACESGFVGKPNRSEPQLSR